MKSINNVSEDDYKEINGLINEVGLSSYELNSDDFICYKKDNKIIAFGRIFNIGRDDYELFSLWVDKKYRGNKIGASIINDLIKNKFNPKNCLFLACKRELENYYKKTFFEIIENDIPEKLVHTLKWGKENDFDAIVMKYYG